ncbi:triose-phosphate isomerase [Candidatus Saccharibacteria bacterium 32-49-12]|nr:MAG: triose-phosphate isomerase [Candidatus Saccharibacteria bacterium 32-49-12]
MKKLIIGNWKMNLNMQEASLYLHKLSELIPAQRTVDVVLAPTMLTLQSLSLQVNRRQFKLAAQNSYWRDQGAYTGEVPAAHLRGIVDYVLIGHSERRYLFMESDKETRAKVQSAVRNHLQPVLCVGETASERANGETRDVLHDQLVGGLANLTADELDELVIAYEPVWAIGTGNNATPDDVKEAVRIIRHQINQLFGARATKEVRVIYGGSVNIDNAQSYLSLDQVDGLLIGGASLDAHQFSEIVDMAYKLEGGRAS